MQHIIFRCPVFRTARPRSLSRWKSCRAVGRFTVAGVFTVVEMHPGKGSISGWGRLKNGAGWVLSDCCVMVQNPNRRTYFYRAAARRSVAFSRVGVCLDKSRRNEAMKCFSFHPDFSIAVWLPFASFCSFSFLLEGNYSESIPANPRPQRCSGCTKCFRRSCSLLCQSLRDQLRQRGFHIIRQIRVRAHGEQTVLHSVLYASFIAASPPRHSLHAEHGKRLIDLVHAHGLLALLQFAHKPKPQPGAERKLLLRETCFFSFLFYKFSYCVHISNMHPIGYNVNNSS